MNFSPFSCPIFLGRPEARGRCSQGKWLLYGRDLRRSGGTGKAEAAKLPGAGIGPKPCPRKCAAEKEYLSKSVGIRTSSRFRTRSKTEKRAEAENNVPKHHPYTRRFCAASSTREGCPCMEDSR